MAIPLTVSSILATGGFAGPFKSSAGAYYLFGRGSSSAIQMRAWKATTPDTSWSLLGAFFSITGAATSTTAGFHSIDAVQDGDTIHIATVDADSATTTSTRVYYHKFSMASDTFTLTNELVDGPTSSIVTTGGAFRSIAIIRRSASVVIAYQLVSVLSMSANWSRVGYRERTDAAGTWGAAVAVDALGTAQTSAAAIVAVKDPQSDRIHFFWGEATALRVRTLSAANAFNTAASVTIASSKQTTSQINPWRGVAGVVGGVSKIVFCNNATSGAILALRFDSADNPTVSNATGATFSGEAIGLNESTNRVFYENGKFYYLTAGASSGDVLAAASTDNGATWSVLALQQTAAISATASQYFSVNAGQVYDRAGNYVIPYVYNDAGTVKYNEATLRPTAGFTTLYWDKFTQWGDAFALTNSNLTVQRTGTSGFYAGILSTMARSTGKYVVKFTADAVGSAFRVGFATTAWSGQRLGGNLESIGLMADGDIEINGQDASPFYTMPGAVTAASVRYVAIDFDLGQVWLHNGTTWFPGDPASVGGMQLDGSPMPDMRGKTWYPAFGTESSEVTSKVTVDGTAAGITLPTGFQSWQPPPTADAWSNNDKSTEIDLSNVDKTATLSVSATAAVRSTQSQLNGVAGKYYAEFAVVGTPPANLGFAPVGDTVTNATSRMFYTLTAGQVNINGSLTSSLATLTTADVLCVAWNTGAEKVWFRKNALAWDGNAGDDPATGAGGFDASFIGSTQYALWMRGTTGGNSVTVRTELAEFTQTVPSGFASWMGEASGPVDINVSTGAQTTLAVTQTSDITVPRNADAAQTTAEATTAGTIQAMEARAVTGAQGTEATTQTSAVALLAKVTTGAQTTSATTQTSEIKALAAVTGAQTLSPVTPTSGVKVGLAVTGAQNTNAATTVADADAIATGTAAQTLAATTQSSGLTLGPASFAVTGAQTLSAATQVLTASLSDPILSVTGAQATLAATSSAVAKALASATGAQTTSAAGSSAGADVDLAATASQTLSPAATSAAAKLLAAVTGEQTLSAATTSATAQALAAVTGAQALSGATTTGAIALVPFGAAVVTGAQTLSPVTQTSAIVLGPLPALNVTGAQTTLACTTTGTISGEVEPPIELPSGGGGGSRAYRRRLREAREGRRVFEEEREKRIAALGVVIERPPLVPAPETVTMINRVLYEPIVRPIEVEPAPQQEFEDDGGEEELLLLLSAA